MSDCFQFAARCQFAVAILLAGVASSAQGAGFAIIEQSASSLGNAFAGSAATAADASTLFFNPAGLTRLDRSQLVVAGHIISPTAKFSNNASSTNPSLGGLPLSGGNGGDGGETAFVPNFYYSHPLGGRFVLGIGINAPFGLETRYDRDWVGRYEGVKSELLTLNINPTLAWRATDRLSLGIGIDAQYIDAELSNAVDFGSLCLASSSSSLIPFSIPTATCIGAGITAPQTADGFATMTGDDWSWGYNLGLTYELSDAVRLGLAYRSRINHTLKGNVDYTAPASAAQAALFNAVFTDQKVTARLNLPESLSLSLAWQSHPDLQWLADITWTRWSRFEELRIIGANGSTTLSVVDESWENVLRYALGLNYRYDDRWTLRAGLAFDEEPIPDARHRTPRIPGNDRRWLSAGFSYRLDADTRIDAGYSHLFISDTPINHADSVSNTLSGSYDNSVDILSAQLVWNL
ncbi:outer membrane protein transport protein [Thiohalobacter sp. IOR34]|uniref:OmpP1/FadL family transporter n=1 Tax=Thiohalobacter sp. IOR34 TaxID=3057176 RepID=UPI0025AED4D4|nr:outer membrane protein transport protein [Thiohalobacter sp. IOR34]WJW76190.1 outer membrane protein transport protein [Thiohalobacter sp. IOR34]